MLSRQAPDDPDGLFYPDGLRRWGDAPPATAAASPPVAPVTPPAATPAAPPPVTNAALPHELTGAERLDLIGSALQDFGNSLPGQASSAADADAWRSQFQHQQDAFAQRIGFQQMPGPYRAVTSATLQPLTGPARPGDRALGALATLYR